jgi:predicted short-subunit dehydrogenase-like oxidoreductase (DUF2520 family)
VLVNDLGFVSAGGFALAALCGCAAVVVALALVVSRRPSSADGNAAAPLAPARVRDACPLEALSFYYDEDDELQLLCLDETDEEDDYTDLDL